MELELLVGFYAVCSLPLGSGFPSWIQGTFYAVTVSSTEISVVCEAARVPSTVPHEPGWRCLKVAGKLDFRLTGVIASLAVPLAAAGVSIFSVSTFDTDYLLVKDDRLEEALTALKNAGHSVSKPI